MTGCQRKLVLHFLRYGPYHMARLASARSALTPLGWDVIGLETASLDSTYGWDPLTTLGDLPRVTVFPDRVADEISSAELYRGIQAILNSLQPDAVAIAGWAQPDALACLKWCRRHGARALLMSETREADGRRRWWRERLKARRIRAFDAALVGAHSHQAYLRKLGFDGPISLGYDVIDNHYFRIAAQRHRCEDSAQGQNSHPYLLASNRFVERKNLGALVDAFAQVAASTDSSQPPDLCLLGDGEQRAMLEQRCRDRGLPLVEAAPWDAEASGEASTSCRVLFPGFRQIDELPRFYAHAMAFVHPALSEPWGLVINEAMAAGLPILSSSNVGAAEELVEEGLNGFLFDPADTHSIAAALRLFLALSHEEQQAMGQASARFLAERCPTSAFGEGLVPLLCDAEA